MARANRKCFLCGNEYRYCPTCSEDRDKPSWYGMFCSEACKELNTILSENNFGRLSDEDASEKIKRMKLPAITIKENRARIDELLAVRRKPAKRFRPEAEFSE